MIAQYKATQCKPRQDNLINDKTIQQTYNAKQYNTIQDKTTQSNYLKKLPDNTRQDNIIQDKARQDNIIKDKTRQTHTTQDNIAPNKTIRCQTIQCKT